MTKISEKSYVSIGVVVIIIGGVMWLTTLFSKVNAQSEAMAAQVDEIKQLKETQRDYNKTVESIDRRLSRIEGRMDDIRPIRRPTH